MEVLVDHIDANPDRPVIVGVVYNASNMPPWALPANATQTGIKTRSSKGGAPGPGLKDGAGDTNVIRFEDKAGAEQLWLHAQNLKKYRVHRYKDRTAFTDKAAQEASHHALQNAHLEFPRGAGGLQDICPGYKEGDGVSIPLDDKPNGAHKKVGAMQEEDAKNHRKNGTRPTYKDARQATKDQMKDGVGMSDAEAECIAKFIDETMKNICPDLVDKNLPMRTW